MFSVPFVNYHNVQIMKYCAKSKEMYTMTKSWILESANLAESNAFIRYFLTIECTFILTYNPNYMNMSEILRFCFVWDKNRGYSPPSFRTFSYICVFLLGFADNLFILTMKSIFWFT